MFCQHCGNKLEQSDLFCDSCGAKNSQNRFQGEVTDAIKDSAQNALSSFKHIVVNPVGNLHSAYNSLDRKQTIGVGVVYSVIFNAFFTIGIYLMLKNTLGGFMGNIPVGIFFKLILCGFVPVVGIAAASALLRQIFHSEGGLESDIFIAGVALLPAGICMLISGFVGILNVEVIAAVSVFALSYTILIIFTGFTRILKISDAGSAIAVPVCLLISIWLSKVMLTSIIS